LTLRGLAALAVATILCGFSSPAAAMIFQFECITFNNAGDCAIGEAQVQMDVVDLGTQVRFDFTNLGPEQSTIARIYFDDGSLMSFDSIVNGAGVDFVAEMFPGPNDLPGGELASPAFVTTLGFLSGAVAPPPTNGVEPGETVGLIFGLDPNQTTDNVIAELESGVLRAGVHVINFESGGSESLVSIPEPGVAGLLALGLAGLAALRRRSARH
jgi:hypothetical protein